MALYRSLLASLSALTAMVVAADECGGAIYPFTITDATMGSGADKLGMKVLSNTATGERVEIIWESGGKTERVRLRSAKTGKVRDIIQTHEGDAAAVRTDARYAGNILLPFANRIRNGTYDYFGSTYHLPLNEVTPGVRADALHGFLYNRTLQVREMGCSNETGEAAAYVTLGYSFDGTSTPGWPFKLDVALTYTLSAGRLAIKTRATNLEDSRAVPWFNSWHPYFAVGSVAQARVEFDSCAPSSMAGASALWSHITMGPGAPRNGDLIPTGAATPWTQFDGVTPIGGASEDKPTYMDDEFKSMLPPSLSVHAACGPWIQQKIHDVGGDQSTLVLFADRQHRVFQIFTGAREGWGWNAIALEPMSALADAYNNGDGLTLLWPGETFEGVFGAAIE